MPVEWTGQVMLLGPYDKAVQATCFSSCRVCNIARTLSYDSGMASAGNIARTMTQKLFFCSSVLCIPAGNISFYLFMDNPLSRFLGVPW